MQLIAQTHPHLTAEINSYGCNFRVLQAIAETTEGRALSVQEILHLYDQAKVKGWVTDHCWVQDNLAIINQTFAYLGSAKRARLIGDVKTVEEALKRGATHLRPRWQTSSTASRALVHFTLSSPKGHLFDPYHPDEARYSLHNLSLIDYRAYQVA